MIDEKVAIITGGSSGIGRATALALAKEGGKIVVVAARHAKEGKETVRLIRKSESNGIFVKTDVADEDDVRSWVEKTIDKYDRLDYAFNNVGIGEIKPSLISQTSNVFDRIMNVNIKGVIKEESRCERAVVEDEEPYQFV